MFWSLAVCIRMCKLLRLVGFSWAIIGSVFLVSRSIKSSKVLQHTEFKRSSLVLYRLCWWTCYFSLVISLRFLLVGVKMAGFNFRVVVIGGMVSEGCRALCQGIRESFCSWWSDQSSSHSMSPLFAPGMLTPSPIVVRHLSWGSRYPQPTRPVRKDGPRSSKTANPGIKVNAYRNPSTISSGSRLSDSQTLFPPFEAHMSETRNITIAGELAPSSRMSSSCSCSDCWC